MIQQKDGTEFDLEADLSTKPSFEVQKARRYSLANQQLRKDPMIICPADQIQGTPGMVNNDLCTFDIFPYSIKLARNHMKDLEMFKKKRARYNISNIRLPEMKVNDHKFRPTRNAEPIPESQSLHYDPIKMKMQMNSGGDDSDLNLVLANIRAILVERNLKFPGISVELIDQIHRFENMNDLTLQTNIEKLITEAQEAGNGSLSNLLI